MAQEARSGTFKTVQGGVKVVQGDAQRAVIPGAGVQEAERVQTDASGSAVLMLRDGTSIAIGPNTTVDISRFQFDGTTQQGSLAVRVLQGTIRMVTGLLGKVQPDNVKVTTPATTVMIGDTSFDMLMARSIGVAGIGVGWGYHAAPELLASGAARVVSTDTIAHPSNAISVAGILAEATTRMLAQRHLQ